MGSGVRTKINRLEVGETVAMVVKERIDSFALRSGAVARAFTVGSIANMNVSTRCACMR